jgi:fluoroquinolone transport system permease protein
VVYPSLCVAGLWWLAKVMFVRYVAAQSGGM